MSFHTPLLSAIRFHKAKPIGPRAHVGTLRDNALHWIARHKFTLAEAAPELVWTIACERHYEIFVNGQSAAWQRNFSNGNLYLHGQVWHSAVSRLLTAGENTLEIVVRFDPWAHKNHKPFQPFLLLEAQASGQKNPLLFTNSSWEIAVLPAEDRERIALGCTHLYEYIRLAPIAEATPWGWPLASLEFRPARVLRGKAKLPPIFHSQSEPKSITHRLDAGRIVAAGHCRLEHAEKLCDLARQLEAARLTHPLAVQKTATGFTLPAGRKDEPRLIVVDFGRLTSSRIFFDILSPSGGSIAVAYGDHLVGDSLDCARMHRQAAELMDAPAGRSRYRGAEPRSFRYLAFFFFGFDDEVSLEGFDIEERSYLRTEGTAFRSSDGLLDQLWQAGLRTAQLCLSEIYMDNPDREQGQWIDNALPIMETGYYWAAETRKAEGTLAEYAQNQTPNGELPGYAPGRWFPRLPLQCHMGLYVVACRNHYMHTGDRKYASAILPTLLRMQRHWEKHRTSRGLIANLHTLFVDWGSHFYSYNYWLTGQPLPAETGILSAMNAYYLLSLGCLIELAGDLGREALVKEARDIAADVRRAMRKHLYDPATGLFRDGADNQEAERHFSQTVNVLAAWAGALPDAEAGALLERAFGPDRPHDIIPANAQFAYQTLNALFSSGCDDLALRWITDGFGPMIDAGYDTLAEKWMHQDNRSACQGSGAAITAALARHVIGVSPAEAGYRKIAFHPRPGSLRFARGRLLTPFGVIEAEWKRRGQKIVAKITLPESLKNRPVVTPASVELRS